MVESHFYDFCENIGIEPTLVKLIISDLTINDSKSAIDADMWT